MTSDFKVCVNPLTNMDFNISSSCFQKVTQPSSLRVGNNYLIRYREMGKFRADYIGKYRNHDNYEILYYRIPREHDSALYNKWITWKSKYTSTLYFPMSEDVSLHYLGDVGQIISKTCHPNATHDNQCAIP